MKQFTFDQVARLENIGLELEGLSKMMTIFHTAFESKDSVLTEDTIVSTLWMCATYLDRIVDDLNQTITAREENKLRNREHMTA